MTGLVKMVVQCLSNLPTEMNDHDAGSPRHGNGDCVKTLKEWTGKTSGTIVYDSTVDEFTDNGLFAHVSGKPNVAIVGFTTDDDVFGGFYSVAVTEQQKGFTDPDVFIFSFESHGRCKTPQRFFVKKWLKGEALVMFWRNKSRGFVTFWVNDVNGFRDSGFCLGNERSKSFCCKMSRGFEGLEKTTLTGQNNTDCDFPPYHHCTRIVAVRFE